MAASLAKLAGGRSTIELETPGQDLGTDKHVQVMQIELARKTVQEMQKCASIGSDIQLGFGKHIMLRYGNRSKTFCATVPHHPVEIYQQVKNRLKLAGVVTHALAPEGAVDAGKEQSAESVAALDKLKNQFASIARDKEANKATLVDEVKRGRNGKITGVVKRTESNDGNSRPGSPSLGASTTKISTSSKPAPTSNANDQAMAKTQAQRFVLLHLLAIRPISLHDLCRLTLIPEPECRALLEKFAERTDSDSKYELLPRRYRELDVWRFPYSDPADRQAAVDNAVRAFDRQRIDPLDGLWQLLLPVDERGKGKSLSKLKLTSNYQQPQSQSKIPTNHRKQLGIALGGSSPLPKSNNAGAKTPLADDAKAVNSDTGKSPKCSLSASPAARSQPKKKRPAQAQKDASHKENGRRKYLSAEFVHSSDDASDDDDDMPLNTIKKRKLEKSESEQKVDVNYAKSDTDKATERKKASFDSSPAKRRKTSSVDAKAQESKSELSSATAGAAVASSSDPVPATKGSDIESKASQQKKVASAERHIRNNHSVSDLSNHGDRKIGTSTKANHARPEKSKVTHPSKPPGDRYKLSSSSSKHQRKTSGTENGTEQHAEAADSAKSQQMQSSQQGVSLKRKDLKEHDEKSVESAAKRRRGTISSNPSSYSASPASTPSGNSRPTSRRSSHANSLTSPSLHDMDLKGMLQDAGQALKKSRSKDNGSVSTLKLSKENASLAKNEASGVSTMSALSSKVDGKHQNNKKIDASIVSISPGNEATVDEMTLRAQSAYVAYVKARVQYDSKTDTNSAAWEKMHRLWQEYSYLKGEQRHLEGASPDSILAEDWQAAVRHSEGSAAYFEQKARELFPEYSALRAKCKREAEDSRSATTEDHERDLDRLDKLDSSLRALARLLRAARNEEKMTNPADKLDDAQLRKSNKSSAATLSREQILEKYRQYHKQLDTYRKGQDHLRARSDYPNLPDEDISNDRKLAQKLAELRAQITGSLEAMILDFSKSIRGKVTRDPSSSSAALRTGEGPVPEDSSDFAAAVHGPILDATQAELARWRTKARFYEWRGKYTQLVSNGAEFGKFDPSVLADLLNELRELRRDQIRVLRAHALDFGAKAEAELADVQTVAFGLGGDASL